MVLIANLVIFALILGLAYALTSEGLWGSALMFFNILFAGMIAFNFYEPLAVQLDKTGINWGFSDCLCFLVLFCVALVALRLTTESLGPTMVRFPMPVYHIGRLVFGFAAAALTMAILLIAFETAPVHKKLFKAYTYEAGAPAVLALDHQWLGFFQLETGGPFVQYSGSGSRDPFGKYGQNQSIKLFDPRGEWLINHQNARPYGDENVPPDEEEAKAEGGEGGGQAGGMPPGGG